MFGVTLVILALLVLSVEGFKLGRMFISKRVLHVLESDQLGRVTMYKKKGCPFCDKATALLEEKYGLSISYVDVEDANQGEILQQMRSFSGGRNTVPQIFFNADHIGGNDDVQILEAEGLLIEKVEAVKSTPVSMMQEGWYHPWY
jgi:glutaredoxin 3